MGIINDFGGLASLILMDYEALRFLAMMESHLNWASMYSAWTGSITRIRSAQSISS